MGLGISILIFTILSLQNESNFVNCSEFTIIDSRNTHYLANPKPGLVTVDIKDCYTNYEVNCDYNHFDDTTIFTPNQGYLIDKVTKRGAVLWDAKNYGNVYGNKVFVGGGEDGNKLFRVYFPQPLQPELLEPPKPLEPETGKPRLVTLDIRNMQSTHEVKYKYDRKHLTHIFTPNKGYLIHDVMKKGKLMWECENGVYPEKVMILPDENGEMVLRFKFPKVDDTQEEPFETDHKLIDLDVDNTRPNPLYSISFTEYFGDFGMIYEAKSVYKFKSVIVGRKTIWRAMDKDDCAYKVRFVDRLYLEQRLTLYFPDGRIKTLINSFHSCSFGKWKEYQSFNNLK